VRGAAYWPKEIKRKDGVSPKEGALRRLDRLRSTLRDLDPVVANRAWREVGVGLQRNNHPYST
jgi:hypothetical protein